MFESLKSLANNIVNLFNRSKFSIACCVSNNTIKVSSPKRKHVKPRSPVRKQRTI